MSMNDRNIELDGELFNSLNRQDIYRIKEQIVKTLQEMDLSVGRLILFGSRSRQDFKSYSDYDILVVTHSDLHIK
jgi:predicted nucleotidyltransferase